MVDKSEDTYFPRGKQTSNLKCYEASIVLLTDGKAVDLLLC